VHVGKRIFENCLLKELNNKTRILVTHQLHYLTEVDKIYVIKDGEIIESGSYQQLVSENGEFARLVSNYR
jgi:ABC-type multidrug transport system fused ATPase/permease subunit